MGVMDQKTLDALSGFPALLEAHYRQFPEQFVRWTPASWEGVPSEPFTALEHLCHVRDIESDGYQVRFTRTLREQQPQLPSLDGLALAHERAYASSDAAEVLATFRGARSQTLQLLRQLTPAQLDRTACYAEYGVVSLASLIHLLCSHDQQHLAGLQWLLAKVRSASPAPR